MNSLLASFVRTKADPRSYMTVPDFAMPLHETELNAKRAVKRKIALNISNRGRCGSQQCSSARRISLVVLSLYALSAVVGKVTTFDKFPTR